MSNIEILLKGVGKLDISSADIDNFGVPLTFNIADIKDISKRKGSFSKTIKILGSKNNNNIFEHLYEIQGQDFSFKMTRKHDCILLVDKNPIMEGFLVLKKINKLLVGDRFEIVYEVSLFDEIKNFFDDIDGKTLHDLDFSSGFTYSGSTETLVYGVGDHLLNPTNIVNTIESNPTYLNVYTYPLVDYGYNIPDQKFPYTAISASAMFPAVFQKAIWDKIFVEAGYSYKSDYLDCNSYAGFFGNMLNIYNKRIDFRNMNYCEYTTEGADLIDGSSAITTTPVDLGRTSCLIDGVWTNYYELTPEYYTEREIDGVAYKGVTIDMDGDYKIILRLDVIDDKSGTFKDTGIAYPTLGYFPPRGSDLLKTITPSSYRIMKFEFKEQDHVILKSWEPDDMKPTAETGKTSTTHSWTFDEDDNFELEEGDFIYFQVKTGVQLEYDFPKEGSPLVKGWNNYEFKDITLAMSLEWYKIKELEATYSDITYDGSQSIEINKILPDMTQAEFIREHIKMSNLYMWLDKEDDRRIHINPREDFYKNGKIVNWNNKIDYHKDINIQALNSMIANNIRFEYELGDDFYNQEYKSLYEEIYGTKDIDLSNPYLKEKQVVDLKHQSYLMENGGDYLYPKLYENPEQNFLDERINYKPLIAFNNHTTTKITSQLKMANFTRTGVRNTIINNMSWATHAKILGGESFDLNYETTGQTFTLSNYDNTRGLYKIFWENYINNLIDDDARLVTYYLYLNVSDILTLDFRNRVSINNQLYYIEKIEYDPSNKLSSKVLLLKEIDPIEEGSFETFYLLKNVGGDYITTNAAGDKIVIN